MFYNIPPRLLITASFVILTILYVGLSWLELNTRVQQTPQLLPVMAKIEVAGQRIYLEVPQTPEQIAKGLMYRTIVPRSRGLLFEFESPKIVQLSMQNILIPLDIIFLKDEQIQLINVAVPPCLSENCPTYSSTTDVNQVIELAGKRVLDLGLKIGERLPIQYLDLDTKIFR